MNYNLSYRIKDAIVDVLRRYFDAERTGVIPRFTDGVERISYSGYEDRIPFIGLYENWEAKSDQLETVDGQTRALALALDDRRYPSLVINAVTGQGVDHSITTTRAAKFSKDTDIYRLFAETSFGSHMRVDDSGVLGENTVVIGGSAELTVSLTSVARTRPEADRIADVVWVFMAHPIFKGVMARKHGLVVLKAPSYGSQSSVEDRATSRRIYFSDLTLGVRGNWEDRPMNIPQLAAVLLDTTPVDP